MDQKRLQMRKATSKTHPDPLSRGDRPHSVLKHDLMYGLFLISPTCSPSLRVSPVTLLTMADFAQVVELMASFPELEELHLMGNDLSTIDSDPAKYLSNLKVGKVQ